LALPYERFVNGRTWGEIAEIFEFKSEDAARKHFARAAAHLQDKYGWQFEP
jgi:hypothetical protein